ncbi:MAG: DUF805 domain-containing protein [Nitrospira sp.]|nr:DUF805 domain-containing protein [Nitrospira sp.]
MNQNKLLSWLSWNGRINRGPYLLMNCAAGLFYKAAERVLNDASVSTFEGALWSMATVAISYLAIVVAIKRAHDRNRSGFFILLFLVPGINLWPIVELTFFRGTSGPNRFGNDPLNEAGLAAPLSYVSVPPDVSSHEHSGFRPETASRLQFPSSDRGFMVGLFVGALTIFLVGSAMFYWMNWRVPGAPLSKVEGSAATAASSEAQSSGVPPRVIPPDLDAAVDSIRRIRKVDGKEVPKVWFQYSFNMDGADYHVVFTQVPQVDPKTGEIKDCHACGAMIDAITYRLVSGRWETLSTQIPFTQAGEYGEAGTPSIGSLQYLRLSDKSVALLIPTGWGQAGSVGTGRHIISFSSTQWRDLGLLETGGSNGEGCDIGDRERCYEYDGEVSVAPEGKAGTYPDLIVVFSGTDESGKSPSSARYRFDGKEYTQVYGK